MPKVFPRCTAGIVETYIAAEGYVYPCCWIANEPHVKAVKSYLGDLYEGLDLRKQSLAAIVDGEAFKLIEDSWDQGMFEPCTRFCGKPIDHDPENKRNKPDKHHHINL